MFIGQQPAVSQGSSLPRLHDHRHTHTHTHHSVRLLWTSDQLLAEMSDNTQPSQETNIHASAGNWTHSERTQTHALDRVGTGIG
jgi:hypothetical protein